jgi:aspartate/methionine/tyrosine aminotransferase
VGEPDEPTPEFIRKAGMDSIAAGETFYTHNLGVPEIRAALAAYLQRLHPGFGAREAVVTSAGVNALMIATQLLVEPGERVVEVVPLWPNLQEIPRILGAHVETVALEFSPFGLHLDLDLLLQSLTPENQGPCTSIPRTIHRLDHHSRRAAGDPRALPPPRHLDLRRRRLRAALLRGGRRRAFLPRHQRAEDRVISTNTFSKTWLMPGWRLGWLVVPAELTADLGKLIEYNTSCAPVFVQRAGIAALKEGEPVIARTLERFRAARDFLVRNCGPSTASSAPCRPAPCMRSSACEGVATVLNSARRWCASGLGLAPGSASGAGGRLRSAGVSPPGEERLAAGVHRLASLHGAPFWVGAPNLCASICRYKYNNIKTCS